MPITKQPVNISFGKGLDTKTDPYQVQLGNFLALSNATFTKNGRLKKRNGYKQLPSLPDTSNSYATTFNGNLTAIGSTLNAVSAGSASWVDKGNFKPVGLTTLPLIRSSTNQSQCDSAVAPNGFICTVYTDNVPVGGTIVQRYKYAVADSITGQNIVEPTLISSNATGAPRVFLLDNYFVIVFTATISSTPHLQFLGVSIANPANNSGIKDISTQYTPASSVAFDAVVAGSQLYVFWNGSDGGGAIRTAYVNSALTVSSDTVFTGHVATVMGVGVDLTPLSGGSPIIYAAFYDASSGDGYIVAIDSNLNKVLNPTLFDNAFVALNITVVAQNGVATVFYEVQNGYAYDTSIPTNYVTKITCTQAGTLGTPTIVVMSLGLASKAFYFGGAIYFLGVYQSPYQPSFFLTDSNGNIIAKLAYSNGGGYLPTGLPSVSLTKATANLSYLIKDLIAPTNKTQGATSNTPVYSQTGINNCTFQLTDVSINSSEIASNLNVSGGFLWSYDGYLPVEQGFNVWPDSVEATWTASSAVTPTGTFASGATTVTVSSASGISVGMTITDTTNSSYIPTGTRVTQINGTTLTISNATTHSGSGDSLSIQGNIAAKPDGSTNTSAYYYQVTYEWADNQGNVSRSAPSIPVAVTTTGSGTAGVITLHIPTLRLTYKIANPVKIVVYRWSVAQQTYYQVTSQVLPLLNDTTVDYVTFVDTLPDTAIIGNSIIYTTGGVVEDIGAPAALATALYKSRLVLIDAEDPNLLWYSKQVIENTPVEMSDLFTIYVAPTTSAQGNTGPMTALGAMDDKLIIFKKNAIYYITGTGPDNTGANNDFSDPVFITSTVGCANQNSIVFVPEGLMFQSDKGIWLLGRDLSTNYIGAGVEEYNQYLVTSAVNQPEENQVLFTLSNGVTLMYDYFYGQWSAYTVSAVSSTLYQGLHTFIDSFGRVFQETPGQYLDGTYPVLMSFSTSWINLAGLQGYQRAYFFTFLGTFVSPHTLTLSIAYDYAPGPTQSTIIYPNNYYGVLGQGSPLGSQSPLGGVGVLEQWKVHLQRQTCQAFQITCQEYFNPFFGTVAGEGLSMSGIDCVVGVKRGYRPIPIQNTAG